MGKDTSVIWLIEAVVVLSEMAIIKIVVDAYFQNLTFAQNIC